MSQRLLRVAMPAQGRDQRPGGLAHGGEAEAAGGALELVGRLPRRVQIARRQGGADLAGLGGQALGEARDQPAELHLLGGLVVGPSHGEAPLQRLDQPVAGDRLGEVVVAARQQALLVVVGGGVGGSASTSSRVSKAWRWKATPVPIAAKPTPAATHGQAPAPLLGALAATRGRRLSMIRVVWPGCTATCRRAGR